MSRIWPIFLILVVLLACKKKKSEAEVSPPTIAAPAPPVASGPCASGRSEDPSKQEMQPVLTAFKAKQYEETQKLLDALLQRHANSATLQVWRGDASLFSFQSSRKNKEKYLAVARDALEFYKKAKELHNDGCKLPEVEEYYLHYDAALAHLRLDSADGALAELEPAFKVWSNSAQLPYTIARAHCIKKDVDKCYDNFEKTLKLAKSLQRPKFLRTHYSLDDWIRRSKRQSEFPLLRKDPRYKTLLKEIRDED